MLSFCSGQDKPFSGFKNHPYNQPYNYNDYTIQRYNEKWNNLRKPRVDYKKEARKSRAQNEMNLYKLVMQNYDESIVYIEDFMKRHNIYEGNEGGKLFTEDWRNKLNQIREIFPKNLNKYIKKSEAKEMNDIDALLSSIYNDWNDENSSFNKWMIEKTDVSATGK